MKHSPSRWFCIVAVLAMGCARLLEASPVRFAFLTDTPALADTVRFLRDAGCERRALASFESLASNRTVRLSLNLSHCPRARDGFYDFASVSALLDALPTTALCEGTDFDCNCFDAAFLLAGARLHTALKPDDLARPFLVWMCLTNRGPTASWIIPAATPRDAFVANYEGGGWDYGGVSTVKFPQEIRDSRICLTAALFGVNVLPNSALTNCSSDVVFPVLQAGWRRSGLRFPNDLEVLLLHLAEGLMLRTTHAGLLFPRGREFTYIEKTCGAGYFIRLDVADKTDVFEWAAQMHADTNTAGKVFVTLNEKITEFRLGPPAIPTHASKPSRS
jgi:hypothetical protein